MTQTERQCLQALWVAVTALAERLTGQTMVVHVENEDGNVLSFSGAHAEWVSSTPPEEAVTHL